MRKQLAQDHLASQRLTWDLVQPLNSTRFPWAIYQIPAPSPTSLNLPLQMCALPAFSQGEGISNTPVPEQAGDGTQPPSPWLKSGCFNLPERIRMPYSAWEKNLEVHAKCGWGRAEKNTNSSFHPNTLSNQQFWTPRAYFPTWGKQRKNSHLISQPTRPVAWLEEES